MVQRISRFLTDEQPTGGAAGPAVKSAGGVQRISRFITEEAPPPVSTPAVGMGDLRAAEAARLPAYEAPPAASRPSLGKSLLRAFERASEGLVKGMTFGLGGPGGLIEKGVSRLFGVTPPPPPVPETTGEKIAAGVGELAGSLVPISGLYGTVGKAAARLIPEAATGLAARVGRAALPGAAAGAIYEGVRGAAQGEPLPEIGKEAAIGAALFGGGDVAARALGKAALAAWQRFRTVPKPPVGVTPLTTSERPLLAPPAAPGEGRVFRPVSWKPGPTAKPVPVATREIPRPAEPMPVGPKLPKTKPIKPGIRIPIEERTFEEVGTRKVKAYMYEHPELKPFYQTEAQRLLNELRDTIKGERFFGRTPEGDLVITGTRRLTSEPIERIKNATGASYKEIEDALLRIIKDEGQENQALAKKIELVIDDNLSRGRKTLEGYYLPPEEPYLVLRDWIRQRETTASAGVEAMAARPGAPAQPAGAPTGPAGPAARRVIIKRLQKVLDIPIRVGRYQQTAPGAVGIFKRRQEVIRTKLAEDLPVIAHEVGHYLDKFFGIRKQIPVGNMRAELVRLGQTQPKNHFTEGIAEFVRRYLSGEDTKALSPEFHVWFENAVRQQPEIWDALQQFRQDFIDYATAPAAARVKAAISVGEGQKRKVTWDRIMGAAVDELRPIDTFVEKATGGKRGNLTAAEDPFVQAWLFRGWTGKARAAIHHGVYDRQGNKVAPALVEILRPVAKNIDDFRAYIVAKRAVELHGRGINPGIELNDARATAAQFDTPEFQKAHEQLKQYQDAILDRLVESGVLSAEQKAVMRQLNQEYVPFYRVFEEQAGGVGFGKRGFGDLTQPVKKIKGSGRTIVDPLESIIKNTYYLTNIAERNNVGRTLVDFAEKFEGMGKFVEKVDPKKYPITFSLDEISGLLDQVGAQVPEDALKKIATIFRPQMMGAPKENILAVFRDGKRELYQLDPELYRATLMLDKEAMNTLVRLLSYPTSWLRAGATLTPEFMVRNVARDAMSAWVYSKYGFIPVVDTIRGLFHVIRRDDLYQKWLSSGGASANFVSLDRDYLQGDLRKLITTTIWGRMKQFAAHPLEVLRAISEFSEEATRLGEFGKGVRTELRRGTAMEEALQRAALASRDITLDFSRMGTMGKPANQLIAFFNASVQGLDKMRRAFTKGGARGIANSTFKALTGITLPSVYLWWLNHDDPRYQELPQWRKDLFWNILTPSHVISIPKPFELGIIFGTLPERVLDWLWDHDQEAMRQFKHTMTEVTFPNWIPTALLPAIEVASNYSFFKGQPLTPMGEQYLLKQEQYGPYTTEAAKEISRALAVGGEAPLSPREIENLVRGYAGGLGMYGLQAISAAMPKEAPAPAKDVTGLPGLKGVSAEYYQGSASIDRFYQRLEELEKKARTVKKYNDAGKPAPANLRFNPAELNYLRQTQRQLADLRKIREQVIKDKTMTPERKKAALDRINIEMINRARAALRMEPIQSHQR